MENNAALHDALITAGLVRVASYAVCMAFRVRFYMDMNAREAMHVIELRTTPQGHPAYRRVCQEMYRLIRSHHPAIAAAMRYVVETPAEAGRIEGERRSDVRRRAAEAAGVSGSSAGEATIEEHGRAGPVVTLAFGRETEASTGEGPVVRAGRPTNTEGGTATTTCAAATKYMPTPAPRDLIRVVVSEVSRPA
jgi:hypothetical protein